MKTYGREALPQARIEGGTSIASRLAGRAWLSACVAAAAVVLLIDAQRACAQSVFRLHTLADGIYAAEVVARPAAYAFANSLVVIGPEGVLVVDTQQSAAAARFLIDAIRQLTTAPVRWVVNTHWHGDHVNGNAAYAAAYPGIEFIAHESVVADMRTLGAARREAERRALPASIEAARRMLLEGTAPSGAALTDVERAHLEQTLALREGYNSELARTTPVEPTLTVKERLEISVGAHRVVLLHAGPAHTRGDLVVVLPDHGIIAAGDLVEAGMPYFDDAYPAGWLHALELLAALAVEGRETNGSQSMIMVPAHGPVTYDASLIDESRRLLTMIVEHAVTGAESSDPAIGETRLSQQLERHWSSRYGVSAEVFRASVQKAIARARLEREGR